MPVKRTRETDRKFLLYDVYSSRKLEKTLVQSYKIITLRFHGHVYIAMYELEWPWATYCGIVWFFTVFYGLLMVFCDLFTVFYGKIFIFYLVLFKDDPL